VIGARIFHDAPQDHFRHFRFFQLVALATSRVIAEASTVQRITSIVSDASGIRQASETGSWRKSGCAPLGRIMRMKNWILTTSVATG